MASHNGLASSQMIKGIYLLWDDQFDVIITARRNDGKFTVLANVLLETGRRLTVVVVLIPTRLATHAPILTWVIVATDRKAEIRFKFSINFKKF